MHVSLLLAAHERRLGQTLEALREHGEIAVVACDVTREEQVQRLVAFAVDTFGGIDGVINNAGLGGTSSVLDMTDEQLTRVLDVTLDNTFRCTRAALRQMVVAERSGGAVVNNASVLGWRARAGQAHDAAAKAGVMRRSGATETWEVADAAGILSGSLYHHFDSKESMVDEILRRFLDDLFGRYEEIAGVRADRVLRGARSALLNELERTGGRYGLQTMCEGGGQPNVTIVERR